MLAAALVLVANADSIGEAIGELSRPLFGTESFRPASLAAGDLARQPVDADTIERSVLAAARLARAGDLEKLASQSRKCHAQLRADPNLVNTQERKHVKEGLWRSDDDVEAHVGALGDAWSICGST